MDDHVDVGAEATGVTPALLDALRPYLTESLMVLDADWTVVANLAPPGGLIGRGLGLGTHTLEDMHPDDALEVMELGMIAFSTEPGWTGSKVVRMRTGSGAYGRYEITAVNRFDDPVVQGMVVRTRELPHDVSETWAGDRPVSAVGLLADLLPVGVLILDPGGAVVYANAGACSLLGRDPEQVKREGIVPAVADADRVAVVDLLAVVSRTVGSARVTVDLDGLGAGRVQIHALSAGADGVASVVVTLEDVTERDAAHRALEVQVNRDELTGLHNRRSIHDVLDACIKGRRAIVVAYLDLDGFKDVNDTWGHERGDQVLVAVARGLRAGLGDDVVVGRMGGDEFVVVAPDDEGRADDADESLAALLRGIVSSVARREGVRTGASVGVGHVRVGDTPQDVLRRADHDMYRAKGVRR